MTDLAARVRGAVYTPPTVARRLAREVVRPGVAVLDPACGDGALLLAALEELGPEGLPLLHGLDTDPEAVAAARANLAAAGGVPASRLEPQIRVGNALVTPDFTQHPAAEPLSAEQIAAIAPCDPATLWPAHRRFGCVLANPPYVKRTDLALGSPAVAAWLRERYPTAGRNADLSLPFVQRILGLLAAGGRAGIIAPSLWVRLKGGAGLRELLGETRQLRGWIDFGAHQVFGKRSTYTALQFFTAEPNEGVRCVWADGPDALGEDPWAEAELIPYEELAQGLAPPAGQAPAGAGGRSRPAQGDLFAPGEPRAAPAARSGPWLLLPQAERRLLAALDGPPLSAVASHVGVRGLETGADELFHFVRDGDRWRTRGGELVELEPDLLHPLATGRSVRPWTLPDDGLHVLFPYPAASPTTPITPEALSARFPKTWAWLKRHEAQLRARRHGRMDGPRWWGYTRRINHARQHEPKLLVPRLVRRLACAWDEAGRFCLDNVDVGGVFAADRTTRGFLAAVLNSSSAGFALRRLSKPFQGDFRSAEKQFLARVPVPVCSSSRRAELAALAERAAAGEATTDTVDELVAEAFGLDAAQRRAIAQG